MEKEKIVNERDAYETLGFRSKVISLIKGFFKSNIDLTKDPIDSSLRIFSIPLAFSFIVNNLYTLIDTYWVSKLGSTAIAAIGISEQLFFLMFTIGMGFSVGAGVIVSRKIGEQNRAHANHAATQALAFMGGTGVLLAVAFYYSLPFILDIMGIKGVERNLTEHFLHAIMIGLPAYFVVFQIGAIIRSTGNSIFPMVALLATSVLNMFLSPLFIFGLGPFPEMGIFGAGLGTSVSQIIGLLFSMVAFYKKITPIELMFKNFKFDWPIIFKMMRISLPAFLQFLIVSLNRVILFSIVNAFGAMAIAANTLGLKVDLFVFMPVFAVGIALEIITGQNLGARQVRRIFKYYKSGIKQLAILLTGLGIAVFFFGSAFASIFTKDPELIAKTTLYLRIMAFSYIFFTIGIISMRVLNGAGATFRSLIMVASMLLGFQLPLVYFLSHYTALREVGVWYGMLASQIFFASVGIIYVYRGSWIRTRV